MNLYFEDLEVFNTIIDSVSSPHIQGSYQLVSADIYLWGAIKYTISNDNKEYRLYNSGPGKLCQFSSNSLLEDHIYWYSTYI